MDSRARARSRPKKVQKLGRYYLLNRIAQGGFAEVYRAVLDAGEGIHRLVAVKCLHSDHGIDTEFSRAFRSEIKVSLGLAHPNIVPTFDFGEESGRPYIVFEYIHGRSLRQVLTRMSDRSRVLSVEHSAFIIEQSAAALHYAHTFRDPITRDPVEIIHRDVSPQNILISFEGVPKLIDFGIAKVMAAAEGKSGLSERTRTGVIKGKPAYLSPEQIRGDTLDGRSDVFALGIVLWETLTGVRLFGGKEHSLAIQAIMDTSFKIEPPSNINPAVPPELDQVVLNALARSREDRFRNARDFQNGLVRFLTKADGAKSRDQYHSEISDLLSDIFAEEIEADQAELRRLNEQVQEIAMNEGRRMEGRPREFSLEELSEIMKAPARERDTFDESTIKSTSHPKPPSPDSRKLVMLPLPDKTPDISLEASVNKGALPGPEEPAAKPELAVRPATAQRGQHLRVVHGPDHDGQTEPMPPVPMPAPPQPTPAAPPLPPVDEPTLSKTLTRTDLSAQRMALTRAVAIFVSLIAGLWLMNKVLKSRHSVGIGDQITTTSRPNFQTDDSSEPDHGGNHKTAEPDTDPEYKDYSVPPIDIVPGNSHGK